jgi:hypothetical protein
MVGVADTSLLAEVQRDLLDAKPLADLLRKCILLGSQSGSAELRAWATKELKGYETLEELPDYRMAAAPIEMDAVTANTWIKGQTVAPSQLPEFARGKITNEVPLFTGVGELVSLYESARSSGKSPQLSVPNWEYIGQAIDAASGNPFQHIQSIYWSLSPSVIAGVLDDIRTALTEIIAELNVVVPHDQALPTAEQATHAVHVAVSGGSPQFTIAAPVTSVQASGASTIEGITGGQTGAAGGDLTQTAMYNAARGDAVKAWLEEYRGALPELDETVRTVAEQQLDQVAAEVSKAEPHSMVVSGLMTSLKTFAQNAVAAVGAGAGTMGLAEVVAHWPL